MKRTISLMVLLFWAQASAATASPVEQAEVVDRIAQLVRKHCPEAKIARDNGKLTARHGTMMFTIHRRLMTGEVLEKTDRVEGPNFKGFILTVSLQSGKYDGQLAVPQTMHEPYWMTYLDCPATEDGNGYYYVRFSYGSRLDREFERALSDTLTALRKPR